MHRRWSHRSTAPRRRSPPDAGLGERAVEIRRHRRRLRPRGEHADRHRVLRGRSANRRTSARTSSRSILEFDTVYSWRVRARVGDDVRTVVELGGVPVAGTARRPRRPTITAGGSDGLRRAALADGSGRDPQAAGRMTRRSCARSRMRSRRRSGIPARNTAVRGNSWIAPLTRCARRTAATATTQARQHERPVASTWRATSTPTTTEFQGRRRSTSSTSSAATAARRRSLSWGDVTDITISSGTLGRTMYPRPGRNVTPAACASAGQ